ncbi:MAG: ZIP family metal transporter [Actinobacteria bacterium]|nr:ZIP family metal transporter [Actinomycetota bacterium]
MATTTTTGGRLPIWVAAGLPVAAIVLLVTVFLVLDPIGSLREIPPVEAVAVERTVLNENEIVLSLRNDGPDTVTIAQVLVNEAYNDFDITDADLGRLESATIQIPYPWEEGLPIGIALLTSTGGLVEHEIEIASLTPQADAKTFLVYGLLGVYIGVIPVAIGLLFFPALRRASARWIGFFLALTVGLLAFLLIDTVAEGVELAGETAASLNGLALFAAGALGVVLALTVLGNALDRRRSGADGSAAAGSGGVRGLALAYLIAAGIGLHNLGEGLAVGAALAAGEVALGSGLVLGFAIHNTTEGLAIVSPLGGNAERPSLWHFAGLGAVAGVPTIFGAWAGGFAFSPAWAAVAFGIAAGAIGQVIWQITKGMKKSTGLASGLGAAGFMTGLVIMYVTGLFAA